MTAPTIGQIIQAIEEAAPLAGQEGWDNSGLVIGEEKTECRGVMLCLDVTPEVVAQAAACRCNLIIGHHPLIFKGLKTLAGNTPQEQAIIAAVRAGIAVYGSHTSLDNAPAPWGVSCEMAAMLGFDILRPLSPSGTGVLASPPVPLSAAGLLDMAVERFSAAGARHGAMPSPGENIGLVALGSGSCGFLIPDAVAAGAGAIITSDVRYHDFLDWGRRIFIIDLTHFDTEKCTKEIFARIISQKFPNFAPLLYRADETNPIAYK